MCYDFSPISMHTMPNQNMRPWYVWSRGLRGHDHFPQLEIASGAIWQNHGNLREHVGFPSGTTPPPKKKSWSSDCFGWLLTMTGYGTFSFCCCQCLYELRLGDSLPDIYYSSIASWAEQRLGTKSGLALLREIFLIPLYSTSPWNTTICFFPSFFRNWGSVSN